jgi:endoglucanase
MAFDLLKRLSDAHGVSGREDEVREVIRTELKALGIDAEEDPLGNLLADAGGPEDGPKVLLDAHMDEIGLMVRHIHPGGQLSFATIGGWDARNLPAQEVAIKTRLGKVEGVIGSKPPHILKADEANQPWNPDALWIDVGTHSAKETQALDVRVGDAAVLDARCVRLREGIFRGKAFDDRVGCYVILETLRALRSENLPVRLFASFTTSEEVGLRGAEVIGRRHDWAVALHLEATVAADVPGVSSDLCPTVFGAGPAISVADKSIIVSDRMVRFLESVAEREGIAWQYKKPIFGGTIAGAVHKSGRGVLCGIISAPCRYIHSPVTLLKESDLEATIKLTVAAVRALKHNLV